MTAIPLLALAAACCAGFTAGALPLMRVGPGRPRVLLSALLALLALYGLGSCLSATRGFAAVPHLMGVGSTLGMGFMPLLYLYVRGLVLPEAPLHMRDLLHGLPLLLQTLVRLPFFLQSGANKLASLTSHPWDAPLNRSLLLALAIGYGVALFRLHRQHEAELPQRHSRLEGRHLTWVLILYASWAVIPLLEVAALVLRGLGAALPPLGLLSSLLTLATAFLGLVRLNPDEAAAQAREPDPPARTSPLSSEREEEILRRIRELMDREPLHRNPDLSLADLAGRLRLPPSYVSRALNSGLGQNFFTFINARRVEEAGRLLREQPDRAVLEIALETGFASKSTFNSAFKKATGMTPSEFRKGCDTAHP